MKAAFAMWKNSRMIILVAVCAAIYGAALIAFKTAIPLIPGITELRVGQIFPIAFGLLFGPAGPGGRPSATSSATSSENPGPGSIAGFIGNFLLGYLPYTLWTRLFPWAISPGSGRRKLAHRLNYFLIAFISGAACAVVISSVVDAMGIIPYAVLRKSSPSTTPWAGGSG